jgi:hypothetical protein
MNGRRNKINILPNVVWDAIFLASNVGLTSPGVSVFKILSSKEIFGFLDCEISMQPVEALRLLDAVGGNSSIF